GSGELGEERCDRIGLVEELATITDGGDRRFDSLGRRQPVGVAEQASQVAPYGFALLTACCSGSPAFEVGAEALVIVGDLTEALVPCKCQQCVEVAGVRRLRKG